MKIGLISDTHIPEARDSLWPHVYELFDGVDYILHAGDIYDIHVIDELHKIAPTYAARGNGDDGSGGRAKLPDDDRLQDSWLLDLNGFKVTMCRCRNLLRT